MPSIIIFVKKLLVFSGVWCKYTTSNSDAFIFDNISITGNVIVDNDSPEGLLETATGVSLNFSDLGKSKLLLNTPKLIKSDNKDNQMIMECPIGMELIFYDSLKNIESVLIADYGKLFSKKQLLTVRENVHFYSYKIERFL